METENQRRKRITKEMEDIISYMKGYQEYWSKHEVRRDVPIQNERNFSPLNFVGNKDGG